MSVSLAQYVSPIWITKIIRILFRCYCRIIFTIYSPLTIIGRENIPTDTPLILCSNHNSHMDTAALGIIAANSYNNIGALAAKDYWFDNPFFHFIANSMFQLIPIQRKNANPNSTDSISLENTLTIAKYFLNNPQKRLIIYPEGTRSTTGKMRNLKNGASFFSLDLNIPILPIYLTGVHEIWGKGKIFMRPKPFQAKIGTPIHPPKKLNKENHKEAAYKLTDLLQEQFTLLAHDKD